MRKCKFAVCCAFKSIEVYVVLHGKHLMKEVWNIPLKCKSTLTDGVSKMKWYSSDAGRENATPTAKSRFLLKTGKVLFRFHSFEWIQVVNQAESTLDLFCGRGLLQRKAAEQQNLSHKSQQNITVLRRKARQAGYHFHGPLSSDLHYHSVRVLCKRCISED